MRRDRTKGTISKPGKYFVSDASPISAPLTAVRSRVAQARARKESGVSCPSDSPAGGQSSVMPAKPIEAFKEYPSFLHAAAIATTIIHAQTETPMPTGSNATGATTS